MSTPAKLDGVRVRTMVVDVDGSSPLDLALEQGLEVELLGVVWTPRFSTHGRGTARVWELRAVRAADIDH